MRNRRFEIRLESEEWLIIQEHRSKAGSKMSMSEYVRRCVLRRKITSKIDQQCIDDLLKVNADLARLGNLMKFTITELSDEADDQAIKNLIAEAHKTMTEAREVQEVLKAKVRELKT